MNPFEALEAELEILRRGIVAAYGLWSEEFYAAGFFSPYPDMVAAFRRHLFSEHIPNGADYEQKMLAIFVDQERVEPNGGRL